ncbi:STAS domain-containing protein [Dactylosporangium salmoneum]|uniref:STAS domain-containing protein n=1 Tax=Dactylosporangium salmoneum TaxID=53361 RepID=A0ABN3I457_9ACTN
MTALLSRDGADFSLVCDACGRLVGSLAASTGDWDTAWNLFSLDGWQGSSLAVGPHTCGVCGPVTSLAGIVARSLDAPSITPAGRVNQRVVTQLLTDVRAIYLRGELGYADNAQLWDLLSGEPGPFAHLMVDLGGVGRLSSATIDVLVRGAQRLADRGGRACLVCAGPGVAAALRMLCLQRVLPTFTDQITALDWLRADEPALRS